MTHKVPSPWNNQVNDWETHENSSTPLSIKKKKCAFSSREGT